MKEMNKDIIDQIDKDAHNSLSMTKINDNDSLCIKPFHI